jgi:hypothetical protein
MSLLDYDERTTSEDEDLDDDYDFNDDRPNLDPVERPTDERGERPNRDYVSPRWGPKRNKGR